MNALLRRLTIRQRMLGSLALLTLVILLLGAWSAWALHVQQGQSEVHQSAQMAVARQTGELLLSLERVQRLEQAVLLNGNNAAESADLKTAWSKSVDTTRGLLADIARQPSAASVLAPARDGLEAYAKEVAGVLQQVVDAKMDPTAGFAYASRAAADLDKARQAAQAWADGARAALDAARAEGAAQAQRDSLVRIVAILLVLAGFGTVMVLTARSITQPLARAAEAASAVARGELSQTIRDEGQDEVARFMRTLGEMQDALRHIVGQVRDSADSIRIASTEVASGNLDLSQRTEQAAGDLQQTASHMQELTQVVQVGADSARQANQLAVSASDVAQRGGNAMDRVVRTMDDISQASRQIADITGVIDGIAFQTNILALNAAVEAARAGEQGRGFAVVAAEVRTLAQRSAEAAKQIKQLIGQSVERVESGTAQVREAGQTMGEIVGSVRRVADIVQEISAASGQQSIGIGHVGQAVHNLDLMTQQNAALVEQSAAAADSLRHQAENLTGLVSTFSLGRESAAARPLMPPAQPRPRPPVPASAEPPLLTVPVAPATIAAVAAGHDDEWTSF